MDDLKKIYLFFILFSFFSLEAYALNKYIRVIQVRGSSFAFLPNSKDPIILKEGMRLAPQSIIATSKNSSVGIEFKSNGMAILGPNSQLIIRKSSAKGLRLISLVKGRMYFQTKPYWKGRAPGVITNIRNYDEGYIGSKYILEYTAAEKNLNVMSDDVEKIKLPKISSDLKEFKKQIDEDSSLEEEDGLDDLDLEDEDGLEDLDIVAEEGLDELLDEEDDGGEEKSLDDSLDAKELKKELLLLKNSNFKTLLKEQNRKPMPKGRVKVIDRIDQNSFKYFLRGVYYNQAPAPESEQTQDVDDEIVFRDFTYDLRAEARVEKKKGKGFLTVAGWLEYGNQTEIYREPLQVFNVRKEGRGIIEVNELYYLFSWDDSDFTVGKKVFKVGTSLIISPTDRITPKDLYDPLNHKDLGNWMLHWDFYSGNITYSYALIPYIVPQKVSRLQNRVSAAAIPDGATPILNYPSPEPKNFQNVFRVKTTTDGWDIFGALFYGPSIFPVYREDFIIDTTNILNSRIEYSEEYPKVVNLSAGFSTNFGKINAYGETLFQRAEGGKDDSYLTYVLGGKYKFGEFSKKLFMNEISLIMEISKESVLEEQSAGKFVHSSIDSRQHTNNLVGRFEFEYSDKITFNFDFDKSFDVPELLTIFAVNYRAKSGLNTKFAFERFEGTSESLLSVLQDSVEVVDKFDRFSLLFTKTF